MKAMKTVSVHLLWCLNWVLLACSTVHATYVWDHHIDPCEAFRTVDQSTWPDPCLIVGDWNDSSIYPPDGSTGSNIWLKYDLSELTEQDIVYAMMLVVDVVDTKWDCAGLKVSYVKEDNWDYSTAKANLPDPCTAISDYNRMHTVATEYEEGVITSDITHFYKQYVADGADGYMSIYIDQTESSGAPRTGSKISEAELVVYTLEDDPCNIPNAVYLAPSLGAITNDQHQTGSVDYYTPFLVGRDCIYEDPWVTTKNRTWLKYQLPLEWPNDMIPAYAILLVNPDYYSCNSSFQAGIHVRRTYSPGWTWPTITHGWANLSSERINRPACNEGACDDICDAIGGSTYGNYTPYDCGLSLLHTEVADWLMSVEDLPEKGPLSFRLAADETYNSGGIGSNHGNPPLIEVSLVEEVVTAEADDLPDFVPFGAYYSWETGIDANDLDDLFAIAADDFSMNTLLINGPPHYQSTISTMVDTAAAHDLKLLINFGALYPKTPIKWYPNGGTYHTLYEFRRIISDIVERVEYADPCNEVVMGYVLCDEPEYEIFHKVDALRLLFRAADPSRFCTVVSASNYVDYYAEHLDVPVIMHDYYVFWCYWNENQSKTNYRYQMNELLDAVDASAFSKVPWMIGQAYCVSGGEQSDDWSYVSSSDYTVRACSACNVGDATTMAPSMAQVRWQLWESIRYGMKGFLLFYLHGHPNSNNDPGDCTTRTVGTYPCMITPDHQPASEFYSSPTVRPLWDNFDELIHSEVQGVIKGWVEITSCPDGIDFVADATSGSDDIELGYFKDIRGATPHKEYVVVVNQDLENNCTVGIVVDNDVDYLRYVSYAGQSENEPVGTISVNGQSKRGRLYNLLPGDGLIVRAVLE